MPNLFIIGSPWHAILAIALSKKEDRYIVEETSESSLRSINNIIPNTNLLAVIKWSDYQFRNNISKPSAFYKLRRKIFKLSEESKLNSFDTIYVFNTNSIISNIITTHSRSRMIVKVEDGVCDYLPFPFYNQAGPVSRLCRDIILAPFGIYSYYQGIDASLISKGMFFFPDKACFTKQKANLFCKKAEILAAISESAKKSNMAELDRSNSALVIGQTLSEDRNCDLDSELSLYSHVFMKLRDQHFDNIEFKPHPRSSTIKIDSILASEKDISVIDDSVPAEYFLTRQNYGTIVGVSSNPVILARQLFNSSSYSVLPYIANNPEFKVSNTLVRTHKVLKDKFPDDYVPFVMD